MFLVQIYNFFLKVRLKSVSLIQKVRLKSVLLVQKVRLKSVILALAASDAEGIKTNVASQFFGWRKGITKQ